MGAVWGPLWGLFWASWGLLGGFSGLLGGLLGPPGSLQGLCRGLCRVLQGYCRVFAGSLQGLCRVFAGGLCRVFAGVLQGLCRVFAGGGAVSSPRPGGWGGPLLDYRNPARQPLAFFHASTCQGTVADLDSWNRGWVEMAMNRRDWKLRERVWALRVVGMVSATP